MKIKPYMIILAGAALLVVAFAATSMAFGPGPRWSWSERAYEQPYGPDRGCLMRGGFFGGYQNQDLSDEQKDRIRKIDEEYFTRTRTLRDDLRRAALELDIALNSDKPNEAKVLDLHKRVTELRNKLDQERVKHFLEVKKIDPDARFRTAMGWNRRGPGQGRWAD